MDLQRQEAASAVMDESSGHAPLHLSCSLNPGRMQDFSSEAPQPPQLQAQTQPLPHPDRLAPRSADRPSSTHFSLAAPSAVVNGSAVNGRAKQNGNAGLPPVDQLPEPVSGAEGTSHPASLPPAEMVDHVPTSTASGEPVGASPRKRKLKGEVLQQQPQGSGHRSQQPDGKQQRLLSSASPGEARATVDTAADREQPQSFPEMPAKGAQGLKGGAPSQLLKTHPSTPATVSPAEASRPGKATSAAPSTGRALQNGTASGKAGVLAGKRKLRKSAASPEAKSVAEPQPAPRGQRTPGASPEAQPPLQGQRTPRAPDERAGPQAQQTPLSPEAKAAARQPNTPATRSATKQKTKVTQSLLDRSIEPLKRPLCLKRVLQADQTPCIVKWHIAHARLFILQVEEDVDFLQPVKPRKAISAVAAAAARAKAAKAAAAAAPAFAAKPVLATPPVPPGAGRGDALPASVTASVAASQAAAVAGKARWGGKPGGKPGASAPPVAAVPAGGARPPPEGPRWNTGGMRQLLAGDSVAMAAGTSKPNTTQIGAPAGATLCTASSLVALALSNVATTNHENGVFWWQSPAGLTQLRRLPG